MDQAIVIVGAGFAGLWSALGAARALDAAGRWDGTIDIAVIAPEPTLHMRPRLHEADPQNMKAPLSELFAAVVVNLVATVLKFGDRTQLGATHLATSLVATFQLLAASMVWVWRLYVTEAPVDGNVMSVIVSLSGGALLANLFSVILLMGETLRQGR